VGLAEDVAARGWYQTIPLPGGVLTPGIVDTASAASRTLLPASLAGKRCLDVGTANGFWAFEMERRGASEVVALALPRMVDADWPAFDALLDGEFPSGDEAFDVAHAALGSKVERRMLSVYDVTREEVGGFAVVFVGTLLLHLRDPIRALTVLRDVTDGDLVLNESVSLPLTMLFPRSPSARLIGTQGPNWWVANVAGLRRMLDAAGYDVVDTTRPYVMRWGAGHRPTWGRAATGARVRGTIRNLGRAVAGLPHVSILARPKR
jgi:tRNA (mo5U34)-methyltransferase